jgi:nicotinate phosphoribosyltransferase
MGVSSDAPALDMVYKLVAYEGTPRLKLSTGKGLPPGPKQVFRTVEGGESVRDLIGRRNEVLPGQPLLRKVMEGGEVLEGGIEPLDAIRERARREVDALPEQLRRLEPADPPYGVTLSEGLRELQVAVAARVTGGRGEP